MNNKKVFGFLSTLGDPLLPFYLGTSKEFGLDNIIVFCDPTGISEKDRKIWNERTGGYFEKKGASLYDLAKYKIPFYFVDHGSDAFISMLKFMEVTTLVNAGTPKKVSKAVLDSLTDGVINIHPGQLPYYRGCSAVEWAIYNDDAVANTVHFMSEEFDQGPIIKVEKYKFSSGSSYQNIRTEVYEKGFILISKILFEMQQNPNKKIKSYRQDEKCAKYWDPIPPVKMREVLSKVENKNYKFQSNNFKEKN